MNGPNNLESLSLESFLHLVYFNTNLLGPFTSSEEKLALNSQPFIFVLTYEWA